MYASVSTGQVHPGKAQEFLAKWRDFVKPMVEGFPGFKASYVLTDEESNTVMVIMIYDTKTDAERTQTSGDYQKAVSHLASALVMESVVRKGYEVGIHLKHGRHESE